MSPRPLNGKSTHVSVHSQKRPSVSVGYGRRLLKSVPKLVLFFLVPLKLSGVLNLAFLYYRWHVLPDGQNPYTYPSLTSPSRVSKADNTSFLWYLEVRFSVGRVGSPRSTSEPKDL